MGIFGWNSKVSEDAEHCVYEGKGTTWPTSGLKEVTIVEKSTGETTKGNGSTMERAREDAWREHDLAQHRHK